jgi:TRAP-type mannitol/chloroaromatic compound transport system permease small subunit
MSATKKFIRFVDRINGVIGTAVSYLVLPLTLIVVFEVASRYIFNAPTVWAWDVNMYLGGLLTILGGGYVHLYKGHVSVEFLLEKWKPENKILMDMILFPFILLPLVLLFWYGWDAAWHSVKIAEHYTSLWDPPLYPLRIAVPVGALLFLLQAISRFLSDLIRYRELKGQEVTE